MGRGAIASWRASHEPVIASMSPEELAECARDAAVRAREAKKSSDSQRRLASTEWQKFELFRARLEELGIQVVLENPSDPSTIQITQAKGGPSDGPDRNPSGGQGSSQR